MHLLAGDSLEVEDGIGSQEDAGRRVFVDAGATLTYLFERFVSLVSKQPNHVTGVSHVIRTRQ